MTRLPLRLLLLTLMAVLLPLTARAAGTPAGTVIINVASVSYHIEDGHEGRNEILSNPVRVTVDEKLDLALVWEDAACLSVEPGARQSMLTYRLTNTGNDSEPFRLDVNNAIPGDQFDPQHPTIVLDSNGNGRYDSGDRPYSPTSPPMIAADAALTIFVFNDIPAPLVSGDQGVSRLIATAFTGSGAPGTAFPPRAEGGRGAVVGPSGAQASADGCYRIGEAGVTLRKSAEVRDQGGGTQPRSGSIITYRIDVTVGGGAPTRGLVVADLVPAHTTYLPGSLRLLTAGGALSFTDAVDGDRGQIVRDPPGSGPTVVQFPLGELAPGTYTVTFQVTIL